MKELLGQIEETVRFEAPQKKEPWQMTRKEYAEAHEGEYERHLRKYTELAQAAAKAKKERLPDIGGKRMLRAVRNDRHKAAVAQRERLRRQGAEEYYRDSHEYEVKTAVQFGKDVPQEVLADVFACNGEGMGRLKE